METSSIGKRRTGMKHVFATSFMILAVACAGHSQDITGDWQGTLTNDMGELRLVLHIAKSADGALNATMDSPDQNLAGMPVDSITLNGTKLKFNAKTISYEGTVRNAGSITGNWFQERKMTLDFKKTASPLKVEHPPAPPSDVDGTWEGTVDFPSQGKQHFTFRFKNSGDGLTATMDSPDQRVNGWPATSVVRKGSSVKIEMLQISGTFHGKLNKDLTGMTGDWSQGPGNYALSLKRVKETQADTQKQP
jgi:hypothetical protein